MRGDAEGNLKRERGEVTEAQGRDGDAIVEGVGLVCHFGGSGGELWGLELGISVGERVHRSGEKW